MSKAVAKLEAEYGEAAAALEAFIARTSRLNVATVLADPTWQSLKARESGLYARLMQAAGTRAQSPRR